MEAWQNYLTMMEHKAQKLPGPARNLWWFGVQYERIYYLGDFLWIHFLLFSHPPSFFSTNLHICATSCCANNLPCCVTSVLCKCVAPTLHFAASPPRPPSPLSLFITSLYFCPARDPAYFDSARQFRPLRYFSLDDYVSCWINVLIW